MVSRLVALTLGLFLLLLVLGAGQGHGVAAPQLASTHTVGGSKWCTKPLVLPFYPDTTMWLRFQKLVASSPTCLKKPQGVTETLGELLEGLPHIDNKGKPKSVIITSEKLKSFAEKLASLHKRIGVESDVVTVEEINSTYSPAEPPPVPLCSQDELGKRWPRSLALKIISFLRNVSSHGVKYVVLLGKVEDVPPVYYSSRVLKEVGAASHCVPTDFFYGDPDYDYEADLAVGRIPLNNPKDLESYYHALEEWMKGGNWSLKAFLAGGAPFAWTLFFGEAAVETASTMPTMSSMVQVKYSLLSEGTETRDAIRRSIGSYGMYFLVMHGSGNALVDYVPGGLWGYDFEEKVTVKDLPSRGQPGLYVSPSCLNAYWDYNTTTPPFKPPSLAEALLARGLAVAYVGPTRISVELITGVTVDRTVVKLSYAGITWLQTLFIEALGVSGAKRVGDAWKVALTQYLRQPEPHYEVATQWGYEDLAVLIALETTLLGDPVAPNPWTLRRPYSVGEPLEWSIEGAEELNASAGVVFTRSLRLVRGNITVLKVVPGSNITLKARSCEISAAHVLGVFRVDTETLIGVRDVQALHDNCSITFTAVPGSPSLTVLVVHRGRSLERHYLVLGGIKAVAQKGMLKVLQVGADLLAVNGVEPLYVTVNGSAVAPMSLEVGEVAVPAVKGSAVVSLVNARPYSLAVGGPELARMRMEIAKKLFTCKARGAAEIPLSLVVEPYYAIPGLRAYYVVIEVGGSPVDANISYKVLEGSAEVQVERKGLGLYVLYVRPLKGDLILVRLCASYAEGSRAMAEGCKVIVVPAHQVARPLEQPSFREETRALSAESLILGLALACAVLAPLAARSFIHAAGSREAS